MGSYRPGRETAEREKEEGKGRGGASARTTAVWTNGHGNGNGRGRGSGNGGETKGAAAGGTDISPISPTFGPRAGAILAGTIARRRSIPVSPASLPTLTQNSNANSNSSAYSHPRTQSNTHTYPSSANDEKSVHRLLRRDQESRIQFEAAWLFIEAHLDHFAERFAGVASEEGGKEEVWREVVEVSERCKVLREERRGNGVGDWGLRGWDWRGREDVRG